MAFVLFEYDSDIALIETPRLGQNIDLIAYLLISAATKLGTVPLYGTQRIALDLTRSSEIRIRNVRFFNHRFNELGIIPATNIELFVLAQKGFIEVIKSIVPSIGPNLEFAQDVATEDLSAIVRYMISLVTNLDVETLTNGNVDSKFLSILAGFSTFVSDHTHEIFNLTTISSLELTKARLVLKSLWLVLEALSIGNYLVLWLKNSEITKLNPDNEIILIERLIAIALNIGVDNKPFDDAAISQRNRIIKVVLQQFKLVSPLLSFGNRQVCDEYIVKLQNIQRWYRWYRRSTFAKMVRVILREIDRSVEI